MKELYKEYLERSSSSIMAKTVIIEKIVGGLVTYSYEYTRGDQKQTGRIENHSISNEELLLFLNEKINKLDPENDVQFDFDDPIVVERKYSGIEVFIYGLIIGMIIGSAITAIVGLINR